MMDTDPPGDDRLTRSAADDERIRSEINGLAGSNDPFVAAVRATRMPMIVTNPRLPDNPVVFANNAFCRLSGYLREEIVGRNCRFLQGPDTDPESVARIRAAVQNAQSIEIDIRNYRKNGETFWNRLLLAPVHDVSGALVYFFASQVDVTIERERLAGLEVHNAALLAEVNDRLRLQQEGEARLRLATETGGLGIWEVELPSATLTISSICQAHFGRGPDDTVSFAEFRDAMGSQTWDRITERAAFGASDHDQGIECRLPSGWIELHATAVTFDGGAAIRIIGTSADITPRKREALRTRALLTLDEQFRVLESPDELAYAAAETLGQTLEVSRAGYGVVDIDAETILIERDWTAPGTQSIAGLVAFRQFGSFIEDIKRGEFVMFADATTDPRTAANADALIAIGARSILNMPVVERGRVVALFFLNHAEIRAWPPEEVAFLREVAQRTRNAVERRRAERDLRHLAASLEMQVAARTRELTDAEATLRQSQKMEAVGQLTGGLAHDFNNMLTGIIGSLELLQTRVAQGRFSELSRYASVAQAAASRAAALTHRLLAFSRQQVLEAKPVNVNRLIAGMEELIQRTLGPAIRLEVVGSASLWTTLVDASQLENALLNLCINSRDAMPDGGRLVIEASNRWLDAQTAKTRELSPGQYVSLCVSDTGSGIPPDVIAKIFDPFFTTKPIGKGTGLGLSSVYGFAKQSGGQVRAYSEPGQGTTICIYLPRHLADTPDTPLSETPTNAGFVATGGTVLVVDDEAAVRMLVRDVLEEAGMTVIEAADGAAAIVILQSSRPIDLLVTDVGLPGGMNGRQVADAARGLRPALTVLFITGYAENAALSHGHLDPGMHVLTKPFAMDLLTRRVSELIGVT